MKEEKINWKSYHAGFMDGLDFALSRELRGKIPKFIAER